MTKWNQFYNCDNPSYGWQLLFNVITDIIDGMCPQRVFNITKKKERPMDNEELLEILYEKEILLNKAKRTKKDNDWIAAKLARNEANIMIRN